MLRRQLALAAVAIAGCHDAPARPAPRPTAPAQASRDLLAQALTAAAADAEQARNHAPPAPPPTDDDIIGALAALAADDLQTDHQGGFGQLGRVPDDPDDPHDDPDDPGGVVGGVIGGTLGGPPPPPPGAIVITLVSDDDDLDPDAVHHHTTILHVRAELCRRQAAAADTMSDTITATVSLSAIGGGSLAVHVNGAGPLTACLQRMPMSTHLPEGATLTFQLTVPPP